MKPALVSLILPLVFLSPPNQGQSAILVTGQVTDSTSKVGLQAANVRVSEAGVSVGTDGAGMYRFVLPPSYKGREIAVQVRMTLSMRPTVPKSVNRPSVTP